MLQLFLSFFFFSFFSNIGHYFVCVVFCKVFFFGGLRGRGSKVGVGVGVGRERKGLRDDISRFDDKMCVAMPISAKHKSTSLFPSAFITSFAISFPTPASAARITQTIIQCTFQHFIGG